MSANNAWCCPHCGGDVYPLIHRRLARAEAVNAENAAMLRELQARLEPWTRPKPKLRVVIGDA